MQVHWAYADVSAIAGKSLFEKCNAVTGSMEIAYMTEPDFIFQNDVYSVVMTPQASILAEVPLLSQMTCGMESIANTLGGWQDWGVCAWKGTRLPYSGKPLYSAFYDPFQHRYQWAYPGKVATRYNVDVIKWGMFIKDAGQGSMVSLTSQTAQLSNVSSVQIGSSPTGTTAPSGNNLSLASQIVAGLPKPLNFPSHEAGYMQVWEARECCLMVLTVSNAIQMIVENLATMGGGMLQTLYTMYNYAQEAYSIIQDPIGAALNFVGDGIVSGLGKISDATGLTGALNSVASGIKESLGAMAG
jgi:hypothetical protein